MFRNPTTDLIVVLVIVLLILGPKRLRTQQGLGTGMREFKDSITGDSKDDDEERPDRRRPRTPSRRPALHRRQQARRRGTRPPLHRLQRTPSPNCVGRAPSSRAS